jgi:GT2 family glycosyltransferase
VTDLTVVVATCNRPAQLAACLHQLRLQLVEGLATEIIVVDESDQCDNAPTLRQFQVATHLRKEKQGLWGAYAKDHGIAHATGRYVCFCDDDNIYYPNALATLFAAALGHDVGVVRANHRAKDGSYRVIPDRWEGSFVFKQIDTMCVCVRTALAAQHRWSEYQRGGTDFAWCKKLELSGADINYVPLVIGVHC